MSRRPSPPRCQFCRRTDGDLVFVPAGDDFRPGRRGYRSTGEPSHRWHTACLEAQDAYETASRAWYAWAELDELRAIRPALSAEWLARRKAKVLELHGPRPTAHPTITYPTPEVIGS